MLDVGAVTHLSSSSNTVTVLGDTSDHLTLGGGAWARGADVVEAGRTFRVYRTGDAIVRVEGGVVLASPPALAQLDFQIDESSPAGTLLGALQASDPDGDVARVEVVEPGSAFEIVGIDLLAVADGATLDRETHPVHRFPARVTGPASG